MSKMIRIFKAPTRTLRLKSGGDRNPHLLHPMTGRMSSRPFETLCCPDSKSVIQRLERGFCFRVQVERAYLRKLCLTKVTKLPQRKSNEDTTTDRPQTLSSAPFWPSSCFLFSPTRSLSKVVTEEVLCRFSSISNNTSTFAQLCCSRFQQPGQHLTNTSIKSILVHAPELPSSESSGLSFNLLAAMSQLRLVSSHRSSLLNSTSILSNFMQILFVTSLFCWTIVAVPGKTNFPSPS